MLQNFPTECKKAHKSSNGSAVKAKTTKREELNKFYAEEIVSGREMWVEGGKAEVSWKEIK
jgi:hypothetical protein